MPDELPPTETWLEREARLGVERAAFRAAEQARQEHEFDARLSRARAWNCDDGRGFCQYCGVMLGVDATSAHTHPDNGCPGPPRSCGECSKPWAFDTATGRWNPTCTAGEHEQRIRDSRWALATKNANPLSPPPRVYRDDNDE